jgi:hypothetical protein
MFSKFKFFNKKSKSDSNSNSSPSESPSFGDSSSSSSRSSESGKPIRLKPAAKRAASKKNKSLFSLKLVKTPIYEIKRRLKRLKEENSKQPPKDFNGLLSVWEISDQSVVKRTLLELKLRIGFFIAVGAVGGFLIMKNGAWLAAAMAIVPTAVGAITSVWRMQLLRQGRFVGFRQWARSVVVGSLFRVKLKKSDPAAPPGISQERGRQDKGRHERAWQDRGRQDRGFQDKDSHDKGSQDKDSRDKGSQDKDSRDKGSQEKDFRDEGSHNEDLGIEWQSKASMKQIDY